MGSQRVRHNWVASLSLSLLGMVCQQERNKRNWFAVSFPATLSHWSEFSTHSAKSCEPPDCVIDERLLGEWNLCLCLDSSTEPGNGAKNQSLCSGQIRLQGWWQGVCRSWSSNPRKLRLGRCGECQELRREQQLRYQREVRQADLERLRQWLHSKRKNHWRNGNTF